MSIQGGQPFQALLGGVSVSIDGLPAPIYSVSSTQLSVMVPYELATNQTGLANIQVTSGSTMSNVVQVYFSDSAPGAFSQGQDGIGLAAALHNATGLLITKDNPAMPGEYISLYVTGLGAVTPAIADGAVAPTSPLSYSNLYNAGLLTVSFNDYGPNGSSAGNVGTIQYAGLVPTLAGLYQINVQVPTSGLAAGDSIYVEFITDTADVNEIQIPYGTAPASGSARKAGTLARASRIRAARPRNPLTRR
jgi:uncharacterized protein (TIGR03437 family)